MKKLLFLAFALSVLSLQCSGSREPEAGKKRARPITVAAAANVQFAMEELEKKFEEETGIEVNVVVSSSGKLAAQILQGAPYSVLVSADVKYPEAVAQEGKAAGRPRIYAYGALVLWTMREALELSPRPDFLLEGPIRKVAIANPRNAPYGEQAINYFKYYGVYEAIEPKLAYGESIAQTNQYILAGAVEAGITAKSVVLSPEMTGKGKWVELPAEAYQPIGQAAVATSYGQDNHPEESSRFLEFMFSEKGRKVLERYGYGLPEEGRGEE
ncbi:MAG: molybdate ABC transporter substrate-binding protein [Phaeodactylibacter sp.]|nr:molybdate ABC transporter substrate-binding protein [Phaeodactylibacter sp.]MCB9052526.1 molybdate ABC transporter substrate-binding protein [Lewinellaceae bacterium]